MEIHALWQMEIFIMEQINAIAIKHADSITSRQIDSNCAVLNSTYVFDIDCGQYSISFDMLHVDTYQFDAGCTHTCTKQASAWLVMDGHRYQIGHSNFDEYISALEVAVVAGWKKAAFLNGAVIYLTYDNLERLYQEAFQLMVMLRSKSA